MGASPEDLPDFPSPAGANCRLRQIFTMREQPQLSIQLEDMVDAPQEASEKGALSGMLQSEGRFCQGDPNIVHAAPTAICTVNLCLGDTIPRGHAFPGGVEGGVETVLINYAVAEMQTVAKSTEMLRSPLRRSPSKVCLACVVLSACAWFVRSC
eukprot:scaffold434_cov186-Pinguiococcus_pyrenoidosus.AAC.58